MSDKTKEIILAAGVIAACLALFALKGDVPTPQLSPTRPSFMDVKEEVP